MPLKHEVYLYSCIFLGSLTPNKNSTNFFASSSLHIKINVTPVLRNHVIEVEEYIKLQKKSLLFVSSESVCITLCNECVCIFNHQFVTGTLYSIPMDYLVILVIYVLLDLLPFF